MPMMRYQMDRLQAFFRDDESTRQTIGYQVDQSEVAIGAGGLTGQGYTEGTQNTLGYLPERHTDFIFSIIAEELGFVGAASTIAATVLLVLLMLRVAMVTKEPFGRLVATGLGIEFAAQAFQNIAMTMHVTPVTGLTLPFVSFGGSSLVTCFLALAVVCSIARTRVQIVATGDLVARDDVREEDEYAAFDTG